MAWIESLTLGELNKVLQWALNDNPELEDQEVSFESFLDLEKTNFYTKMSRNIFKEQWERIEKLRNIKNLMNEN